MRVERKKRRKRRRGVKREEKGHSALINLLWGSIWPRSSSWLGIVQDDPTSYPSPSEKSYVPVRPLFART